MSVIAFLDLFPPVPYTLDTLKNKSTGGTILATLLIAKLLSDENEVYLVQKDSVKTADSDVKYITIQEFESIEVDVIVTVRVSFQRDEKYSHYWLRKNFQNCRIYHWHHLVIKPPFLKEKLLSYFGEHNYFTTIRLLFKSCEENGIDVVAVSKFHRENILSLARLYFPAFRKSVYYIYNPTLDAAFDKRENTQVYDNNKIIYFSNPNRGLERAISLVKEIREECPSVVLNVAVPGYYRFSKWGGAAENKLVKYLGALNRFDLYKNIASSLCVLYPNIGKEESFGYVYSESNMLGCPVMAHDCGSASEILSSDEQVLDCRDTASVIQTFMKWREVSRPAVSLKKNLHNDSIKTRWLELIRIGYVDNIL